MTNNKNKACPKRSETRARRGEPHPQLFSDRADRRRTGGRHLVADLVVRHLGRQSGAAVHSGDVPAGNLSAGAHSGARPDHRLCGADLARLPHRQPGRPQAGRHRRGFFEPHADRAADLPHRQADFPDAVLQLGIELPPRRPGRIPVARHVVAGFPHPIAERGNFGAAAGDRACLRLHAMHAEPDHRLLLLRAAARRDRSRHYR